MKLTNDLIDCLAIKGLESIHELHCRRYKLGRLVEQVMATTLFRPKASRISDFNGTTISVLSTLLQNSVSDYCVRSKKDCYRRCLYEGTDFTQEINKLIDNETGLPKEFADHFHQE